MCFRGRLEVDDDLTIAAAGEEDDAEGGAEELEGQAAVATAGVEDEAGERAIELEVVALEVVAAAFLGKALFFPSFMAAGMPSL